MQRGALDRSHLVCLFFVVVGASDKLLGEYMWIPTLIPLSLSITDQLMLFLQGKPRSLWVFLPLALLALSFVLLSCEAAQGEAATGVETATAAAGIETATAAGKGLLAADETVDEIDEEDVEGEVADADPGDTDLQKKDVPKVAAKPAKPAASTPADAPAAVDAPAPKVNPKKKRDKKAAFKNQVCMHAHSPGYCWHAVKGRGMGGQCTAFKQ